MRTLNLQINPFGSDEWGFIERVPQLQQLDLSAHYSLKDDHLLVIATHLSRLFYLNVASNHITNRGVAHLSILNELTHLGLKSPSVSEEGLAPLAALPLHHTNVWGAPLEGLSQLRLLNLSQWTRPFRADRFASLPTLTHLDLSETLVLDTDLPFLGDCRRLERLNLNRCRGIGGTGLAGLRGLSLRVLSLERLDLASFDHLRHLSALSSLERLSLAYTMGQNWKLSDEPLRYLSSLPLKWLDLSDAFDLTEASIPTLSALPLRRLSLADCPRLGAIGISRLLQTQTALEELDLRNGNAIDSTLAQIRIHPTLRRLNLSGNRKITERGWAELKERHFETLSVTGCGRVPLPLSRFPKFSQALPLNGSPATVNGAFTNRTEPLGFPQSFATTLTDRVPPEGPNDALLYTPFE